MVDVGAVHLGNLLEECTRDAALPGSALLELTMREARQGQLELLLHLAGGEPPDERHRQHHRRLSLVLRHRGHTNA